MKKKISENCVKSCKILASVELFIYFADENRIW